jgi:thioredoxin 1
MNKTVNEMTFKKDVLESKRLVLVQFKKEWNGASQIIAPVYNDLGESYKEAAHFFTVDTEIEKGLAVEYGIIEIPTILFFRDGKVVDHVVGLTPKNDLVSKIEAAIANQ